VEGKGLNYRIMVEVNNVNIIFDLLRRSNLVTILSESTTIPQPNMKAVPIDAADNEMDGCIHLLKDSYMKNSAQEFIRMLSQSTSILANFAFKDILS
jgi:LysR family cyn operon transcriptional activator